MKTYRIHHVSGGALQLTLDDKLVGTLDIDPELAERIANLLTASDARIIGLEVERLFPVPDRHQEIARQLEQQAARLRDLGRFKGLPTYLRAAADDAADLAAEIGRTAEAVEAIGLTDEVSR